jgi:hypothetical protein
VIDEAVPLRSAVILTQTGLPDPLEQVLHQKPAYDGRLLVQDGFKTVVLPFLRYEIGCTAGDFSRPSRVLSSKLRIRCSDDESSPPIRFMCK